MKPKSLMKRSAFASRRKVLLYVLTAILAVSIVGAWGVSDGIPTVPVAGERIVMWQELPASGTPEDYDLLTNLKFASQRIYTASYFRSETYGTVEGKSAGIPITQTVRNTRVKKRDPERGDIIFAEAISTSSLVDSYEQQYSEGDIVFTRQRKSGEGSDTVWEDKATHLSLAAYSERYGTIPKELSKYVIGYTADMQNAGKTVFTVLSARDDNAVTKAAATAAATPAAGGDNKINGEDGAVAPIDVPQTLVADENGHYTFTVELDPLNSTKYYRNEVKTRAGKSASYPSFISSSITFTIDRNWNPISVTTNEKYEISIGISATCTSTLTEVFSQINDPDGKVPEEEFFAPLADEVRKNTSADGTGTDIDNNGGDKVPTSPIEYLAVAFADYFGGVKPLSLNADIKVGDFSVDSLKLSVDFGTMNVRVKLGALYLEYADDRVYVKLNDIKGYVSKAEFDELMRSGALGGIANALPDFSTLMGDDAISEIFANCEMTTADGVTRIRLPFELDGIKIDASLYMNDKDLSLGSITGEISAFGTNISVTAKPISKLPAFPDSYEGYTDLSGILDFIPDALATAQSKTYGVSGTVRVNGTELGVDAYIDRTDGITLDADVAAFGQKLNIKLIDGEMFASIGNINVRGTADELPALLDAAAKATGAELGALTDFLPMLQKLIPTDASTVVGMLKSLSVSDDALTVGVGYMGIPLNLTLRRGDGRLTGVAFDTAVDMFGIKANAAASLELSAPAPRKVKPNDGEYITLTQLAQILNDAAPYISAQGYAVQLGGALDVGGKTYPLGITARINRTETENGEQIAVAARISALGQTLYATYADGTAYVEIGSLRFKLAPDATLDAVTPLLDAAGISFGTADATQIISAAIAAVKSLSINADGAIAADIAANGVSAQATVNVNTGALDASMNGAGVKLALGGTLLPASPEPISAPDGEFTDAALLLPVVSAAMPIVKEKALSAQISLAINGTAYRADVALSFADGIKAKITESTLGAQITLIGNTVFVALGDIKVVGSADDVPALIDALRAALPQNALAAIDAFIGMLDGDIDLQSLVAQALGAVKSFTATDGGMEIVLALGETATATMTLASDLSTAKISASANGTDATAELFDITAGCAAITAPDGDFAAAREIIAIVAPVLPLATRDALSLGLGGSILGVPVTRGNVNIDLANKAFSLDVTLADFNAAVAFVGGTVYIDANGGGASPVKISCGTTPEELKALLHKLDYAMPGIEAKVYELLKILENTTLKELLGMFALSSAENGFKATIDTRAIGFDSLTQLTFTRTPDGFGISVACAMAIDENTRLELAARVSADASDGILGSISVDNADLTVSKDNGACDTVAIISPATPVTLTVAADAAPVAVNGEYVPMSLVSEYIAPAVNLIKQAQGARTVTLGLDAFALVSDKYTQIGGEITLALDETTDEYGNTQTTLGGVHANVILFKNTVSEETVELTYVNDIAYIRTGEITLRLDMSDGASSDFIRLYNVLAEYLPEYLCDELAKLLGLKEGASMFSDVSLIVERIAEIAAADGASGIARLLFAPLNNLAGDSAIKTLMNMISLSVSHNADGDELTATLNAMGVSASVTPHIGADGNIGTLAIAAGMQSLGLTLGADASIAFSPDATSIGVPANADAYVSVAEFVEAINSGIHTFMTKDADGNITFEVTTLDFDYSTFETEKTLDENGNEITVKDEAGRDKPAVDADGNKITADVIKVANKPGESAIKGKFENVYETNADGERITDADGDYIIKEVRFGLEAHVVLDVSSLAYAPLTLDLYVLKNDRYPDGIACVYYTESNGYGERISIDYVSVMQLLAAVMDMVGAKDETVEYLLGEYRLPIDTDVFDSMAIAGFGSVRDMLDGLAQAVIHVKDALADAKAAINLINTAGSVDNLRARMDDVTETETVDGVEITVVKQRGIKSYLAAAVENVKLAIAAFGQDDATVEPEPEPDAAPELDYTVLNGELFKKIVNGVRFVKTDNSIGAIIDNAITTDTDGEAVVEITQNNGTVDSITVSGLDLNTAKLDNFDMRFTAGMPVDISLPDDYASPADSKITYSNLADVKHLLFDAMNTANLMEFDIGGLDTSDAISITMSLGADWLANLKLNIKYNVKVKILKVGEDADGKPIYKTAAAVEIHNEKSQVKILNIGSTVIVPDCTTRLFFYDDVLYVQGVRDWSASAQSVVGTVTDITCIADRFGKKETRYPAIKNTEYLYETVDNLNYAEVMYTVDELFWMMNNDMNRFLDEFLFYLIPITTEKVAGQDIRGLIKSNISGSSDGKDTSTKTPAQIFKGYNYNDGKHSLTLGLAELASSSSLGDLNISLTGANDGDDNVLDNYVASLNVNTKIAGIITVNLDATLRNVAVAPDGSGISSKGLAPTNVSLESGKYSIGGADYVLDSYNYDRNVVYTLDGLTYYTADGDALYIENGSFSPVLLPTSGTTTWTSTIAETRYCDSAYKFGDTGATYYYTASLDGYGYRKASARDTYYVGVNADGSKYLYRTENGAQIRVAVKSITENVLAQVEFAPDGKILSVTNRAGGIQWQRPWKAAYDAAQAA